jgi:hypothetical protein
MRHPYAWLPEETLKPIFKKILPLSLLVSLAMATLDHQLKNPDFAPLGILSLQFAKTEYAVRNLFASWTGPAHLFLQFSLGLDYLYMVSYSVTISLACVLAGMKHSRLKTWAALLAWAQLLAALLDAIENGACVWALHSGVTELTTQLTYRCATVKFLLIFQGLLFCLWALLAPSKKST